MKKLKTEELIELKGGEIINPIDGSTNPIDVNNTNEVISCKCMFLNTAVIKNINKENGCQCLCKS